MDGPNATVEKRLQSVQPTNCDKQPPPAPPYFGVTHHIVPQYPIPNLETEDKVFVAPSDSKNTEKNTAIEVQFKEPTYASIDEMKGYTNSNSSSSGSCASSSSSSSSSRENNENDQKRLRKGFSGAVGAGSDVGSVGGGGGMSGGGRGFGVLSDISERTEETEGGTSAPSSIAGVGHEERENTLLDLALQQVSLVHEEENKTVGK